MKHWIVWSLSTLGNVDHKPRKQWNTFFKVLFSKCDCDIISRPGLWKYLHRLILGLAKSSSAKFIAVCLVLEKCYFLIWLMTTSMGVVYGKSLHETNQSCTRNIPTQLPTPSRERCFVTKFVYDVINKLRLWKFLKTQIRVIKGIFLSNFTF